MPGDAYRGEKMTPDDLPGFASVTPQRTTGQRIYAPFVANLGSCPCAAGIDQQGHREVQIQRRYV